MQLNTVAQAAPHQDFGSGSQKKKGPPAPPPPAPPPPPPASVNVWVGPASSAPSGSLVYSNLQAVPWTGLTPGTTVTVAPGPQTGPVTITSQGTALAPITVRAADPAQPPIVNSSFDFQGAAYVSLQNFVVDGSPWGSVVVRRGSHHITVKGNTLRRSYMGLNISDGAGEGLQILDNIIEDQQTHGIAVQTLNTALAAPSRIAGNVIRRSGHHGMELQTNYWTIERNTVSDSGLAIGGTSGIHLFSTSPTEASGDFNTIRYNFSFNNHDVLVRSDGNGIQADQWCDNNTIVYNVVWGNDGAGIILFDSANNLVKGNTAVDNARDEGRLASNAGDLILSATGTTSRSSGNSVFNNTLSVRRTGATAMTIDANTAKVRNVLGPNLYSPHPLGTAVFRKGGQTGTSTAEVNTLSGVSGNAVEALSFADESMPLSHGLRLARQPSKLGLVPTELDFLNVAPQAGYSYFGAYYTAR